MHACMSIRRLNFACVKKNSQKITKLNENSSRVSSAQIVATNFTQKWFVKIIATLLTFSEAVILTAFSLKVFSFSQTHSCQRFFASPSFNLHGSVDLLENNQSRDSDEVDFVANKHIAFQSGAKIMNFNFSALTDHVAHTDKQRCAKGRFPRKSIARFQHTRRSMPVYCRKSCAFWASDKF